MSWGCKPRKAPACVVSSLPGRRKSFRHSFGSLCLGVGYLAMIGFVSIIVDFSLKIRTRARRRIPSPTPLDFKIAFDHKKTPKRITCVIRSL